LLQYAPRWLGEHLNSVPHLRQIAIFMGSFFLAKGPSTRRSSRALRATN
jgi:hypothetical protein